MKGSLSLSMIYLFILCGGWPKASIGLLLLGPPPTTPDCPTLWQRNVCLVLLSHLRTCCWNSLTFWIIPNCLPLCLLSPGSRLWGGLHQLGAVFQPHRWVYFSPPLTLPCLHHFDCGACVGVCESHSLVSWCCCAREVCHPGEDCGVSQPVSETNS